MEWLSEADKAYREQRNNAQKRNVPWEFDFHDWLRVWVESGKMHLRGQGKGRYMMGRRNDIGPYRADNVYIIEHGANSREAHLGKHRPKLKAKGWTIAHHKDKGQYRLCIRDRENKKYLTAGFFPTHAEAELHVPLALFVFKAKL